MRYGPLNSCFPPVPRTHSGSGRRYCGKEIDMYIRRRRLDKAKSSVFGHLRYVRSFICPRRPWIRESIRRKRRCASSRDCTPPRFSPSRPHCVIPYPYGAVTGREYHYPSGCHRAGRTLSVFQNETFSLAPACRNGQARGHGASLMGARRFPRITGIKVPDRMCIRFSKYVLRTLKKCPLKW